MEDVRKSFCQSFELLIDDIHLLLQTQTINKNYTINALTRGGPKHEEASTDSGKSMLFFCDINFALE